MNTYRTIDLFAGIGGIRQGFEAFGCKNVFTSEWDKVAQKMYTANFGEIPKGDITKINPMDIPEHDILLAGFPCYYSVLSEAGRVFQIHTVHFYSTYKKFCASNNLTLFC